MNIPLRESIHSHFGTCNNPPLATALSLHNYCQGLLCLLRRLWSVAWRTVATHCVSILGVINAIYGTHASMSKKHQYINTTCMASMPSQARRKSDKSTTSSNWISSFQLPTRTDGLYVLTLILAVKSDGCLVLIRRKSSSTLLWPAVTQLLLGDL